LNFLDQREPIAGLGGRTVGDFWQWAYSDILSNRNRSIFAEYIVGIALGVIDSPRIEWDAADLCYRGFKIEVKASAYVQEWWQNKLSTIRYGISKARFWDRTTNKYIGQPTRCAHVYVFCLYSETDKAKANANILKVESWEFYVASTETLNQECPSAESLSLETVQRICHKCVFDQLKEAMDNVLSGAAIHIRNGNKRLGVIRYRNGLMTAFDIHRRILAQYNPSNQITRDPVNRLLERGNVLEVLIRATSKNPKTAKPIATMKLFGHRLCGSKPVRSYLSFTSVPYRLYRGCSKAG